MDDLISRQAAIDAVKKAITSQWWEEAEQALNYLPSAERRGRWIDGNRLQSCSICGYRGKKSWNYCPNCGARMEASE